MERSYEVLHRRFIAYKKHREEIDAKQEIMSQTMLHLDAKGMEQKKRVLELELELAALRGEVVHLNPQLVAARVVRDQAFGYGYGASVARL